MKSDTKVNLKYLTVTKTLRNEIKTGVFASGDKLPGEHELAGRFDVSYITMRKAISCLVEEELLVRVHGKGTFVAAQPNVVSAIGAPMALLLPAVLLRQDPHYFPEVLDGFQSEMDAQSRRVTIHNYDAVLNSSVLNQGCCVACLLFETPDIAMIEGLRDGGCKVLAINNYSGRRSIPSIRIDDAQGVENAVKYLAELGHERIGYVDGPPDNIDAGLRLKGFRNAVRRLQIKSAPISGCGFNAASGYDAAMSLLSAHNRPTALVCASDLSALGAIKAAGDVGLSVPRGLSVVGFGDFPIAGFFSPGLTTIKQDRYALGKAAAAALIQLADGFVPLDVILPTSLVMRDSAIAAHRGVSAAIATA